MCYVIYQLIYDVYGLKFPLNNPEITTLLCQMELHLTTSLIFLSKIEHAVALKDFISEWKSFQGHSVNMDKYSKERSPG